MCLSCMMADYSKSNSSAGSLTVILTAIVSSQILLYLKGSTSYKSMLIFLPLTSLYKGARYLYLQIASSPGFKSSLTCYLISGLLSSCTRGLNGQVIYDSFLTVNSKLTSCPSSILMSRKSSLTNTASLDLFYK